MRLRFFKPKQVNVLPPFNKGGNRIVSRAATDFSRIEAPFRTKRAEKLIIERDFGNKTTIVQLFYDSKDRLIGQKRENYQANTLTDYSESRYTVRRNLEWDKYVISLSDVQSITYNPDNLIKSATRHKVDIVKEAGIEEPSINIIKYNTTSNPDQTFAEHFSITNQESFITAESVRSNNGELLDITTTASENIPTEIANDQYIVLRGMPDEIAIKSLLRIFGKKEKLENLDDLSLFFIKGDDINYLQGVAIRKTNRIGIATFPTLGDNINTAAHEIRHFKQHEFKNKLFRQLWNRFFNKEEYNPRELKLAIHFFKCRLFECPFPDNPLTRKWYLNSGTEKDAYKIGDRFQEDFKRRTKMLKKIFPKATRHNIGVEAMWPSK